MRSMHDSRVSWGTYQDALCVDPSQWHCNAHANNVVVLPEGSPETRWTTLFVNGECEHSALQCV